jgi:hypothetical protein
MSEAWRLLRGSAGGNAHEDTVAEISAEHNSGGRSLIPEEMDREELERFGKILDSRPASLRGRTVAMELAEQLLKVRTREGSTAPLRANAMQRAF